MFRALALSIAQLADPRLLRVLAKSLGLTLLVFAGLGVAIWWVLAGWIEAWLGEGDTLLAGIGTAAIELLAFWLLFRAISIAVLWLFGDEIVAAVEARHYLEAAVRARPVPVARAALMGLASGLRVTLVNLLLVPLYLVLLATGVGTAALFFVVNGWLLGRDMGDMVASRHGNLTSMRAWRRRTGPARFALGLGTTALFLMPVVFLVAPLLGAAMATHLYHRTDEA